MPAPDPLGVCPIAGLPRTVFLRTIVDRENIVVGDYSYYDDPEHAAAFADRNVLYHFGPEKLIIGKFCSIAAGTRFIMSGANHKRDGISTFPFPVFGGAWEHAAPQLAGLPIRGNTIVGNDVWIGYEALILPGVRIGNGAIIGARSVVSRDVPAYATVAGNPAAIVKMRYEASDIARLERIAWWDWPIDKISRNVSRIMEGDIGALERVE